MRSKKNRFNESNTRRGLLSEYGVISPKGHKAFVILLGNICDPEHDAVSPILKVQFRLVKEEYQQLSDRIADIQKELTQVVAQQPQCQLISTIPGIGVINATAIYSAIGDGEQFRNAREFAVWLGVTPRKRQSGNKSSSGAITKRGDRYLRKQLVHGARALLYRCRDKTDRLSCGQTLLSQDVGTIKPAWQWQRVWHDCAGYCCGKTNRIVQLSNHILYRVLSI